MSLSTTHAPHEVAVGLIVAEHQASEEVHAPCEVGIGGGGSRRPVVRRLRILKGMAVGKGRVDLFRVHKARQLLDRRQPPSLTTTHTITHRFVVAVKERRDPGLC